MSYKALYRTYRPQTFEEVAGQEAIVKTLKNALEKNKIAHAYLFCGPRGTGKTTMAKLFAKALNCKEGQGHQCNQCSNCIEIMNGTHPDVIEIDAASNNGVDEVRNIVDKVKYLPIEGKKKVYIIDEVHMMTAGAFNALLKTLEEPPEHVVFILATTEPHKILPTIISRCQRFDFSKVEDGDIFNRIITILESEHVDYEEEALRIIVELADGGVRDALSMLDQVLAYSSDKIRTSDVLTLFSMASKDEKINLLKLIAKKDVRTVLEKMDTFIENGVDIKHLVSNMLEILRDLLVFEHGGESYQLLVLRENEAQDLSSAINQKVCLEMIDVLLKAQMDFKNVPNIRSLFEIALLKLCSIENAPIIQKTMQEPAPIEQQVEQKPAEKPIEKPVIIETKTEPQIMLEPKPTIMKEEPKVEEPIEEKKDDLIFDNVDPSWLLDNDTPDISTTDEEQETVIEDETIIKAMVIASKDERLKLTSVWPKIASLETHPKIGKYASILKDGVPAVVCKELVMLQYEFNTKVKKINKPSLQKYFSEVVSALLNRKVFVYAVSRAESIRLNKQFSNLRQINKLPRPSTVVLNLPKIGD